MTGSPLTPPIAVIMKDRPGNSKWTPEQRIRQGRFGLFLSRPLDDSIFAAAAIPALIAAGLRVVFDWKRAGG